MSTFLRFFAVLVAIAFVIVTFVVLLFQPVGTRVMQAAMYKDALADERIYEKAPALVGETMRFAVEEQARRRRDSAEPVSDEEEQFSEILGQLEPQDWTTLLGGVVPPELLRTEVERGLDAADAFVHGRSGDVASGKISLLEIKRRLTGSEATDAYAAMLATKPPCTPEQLERAFDLPISCQPTPDRMAAALDNFRRIANGAAEQMPDEIDLLEDLRQLDGPEGSSSSLSDVRTTVRLTELIARWSPVVPVVLAILIAIFVVRTVRGLLMWWGIPCFVAGGMGAMVAGAFVAFGIGLMSGAATADLPPDVPLALVQAILGVGAALIRAVMLPALWASMALGLGGMVATIIALATRPKTVAVPPPPPSFRA